MGGPADDDPVIDIRPFGMVIMAFGSQCHPRDKAEGGAESFEQKLLLDAGSILGKSPAVEIPEAASSSSCAISSGMICLPCAFQPVSVIIARNARCLHAISKFARSMPKSPLIICHAPSPNTRALAEAALAVPATRMPARYRRASSRYLMCRRPICWRPTRC